MTLKIYEITAGYSLNRLSALNTEDKNIMMHSYFGAFKYNHNNDLSFNTKIQALTSNSVETTDINRQSELNTDVNILAGVFYKLTPQIFSALSVDYTINAEVMPDFDTDLSVSYKFSQHMDIFLSYKFTYDKLDTYEKNDTLKNHIIAPGISFYFSNLKYIKITPTLSTDFNDYNFLVSVTQNFGLDSYNLFAGSIYYGAGKRIMEYSDSTVDHNLKSYGVSLSYAHFFNTIFGIETFAAYSNFINEYESVTVGIKAIYRF